MKYTPSAELPPDQLEARRAAARVASKAYRERHPERIKAYNKRYYDENAAKERKRVRDRRAADPEKARKQARESVKRWRERHPEHARAYIATFTRKRRAAKHSNGPCEDIKMDVLAARDNWRCHICGKRVTRKTWSMDHLVPLSRGGTHESTNVALAHKRCNSRRGAGRLPAQLLLV